MTNIFNKSGTWTCVVFSVNNTAWWWPKSKYHICVPVTNANDIVNKSMRVANVSSRTLTCVLCWDYRSWIYFVTLPGGKMGSFTHTLWIVIVSDYKTTCSNSAISYINKISQSLRQGEITTYNTVEQWSCWRWWWLWVHLSTSLWPYPMKVCKKVGIAERQWKNILVVAVDWVV